MDGWIKLHRQIVKSSKFADPDILRLWILCLTKASHKGGTVLIEKQEIQLSPGQFVTGRFSLQQDYNEQLAPRNKVKDTTLWSWLKRLEQWGDIDINSTNKYSVISILKWSEYQETLTTESQQTDNKMTAERQQTDTNKNVKNVKNEEKVKKEKPYTPEFDEFWNMYPRKIGKLEAFKTWEKVIKKGESPQTIIQCAANYAQDCINKQTEEQFIKHPKTFLNDDRYKDYKVIVISQNKPSGGNVWDRMEEEARRNGSTGYYQTGTDLFS